ncbi:hypothetical protein [Methanosarcina mazei]|uniref:hypothetical protein n=1 Tax=Methanosarcina mazei TaxID=2209 RepID=UPI003C752EB2
MKLPTLIILIGLLGFTGICIYVFSGFTIVEEEYKVVKIDERYTLIENENKSMYINTLPATSINDTIIIVTRYSYIHPNGEVSIINKNHISIRHENNIYIQI